MCDLPEEELAEYLLWLEYAASRGKIGVASPRARTTVPLSAVEPSEPVAAST